MSVNKKLPGNQKHHSAAAPTLMSRREMLRSTALSTASMILLSQLPDKACAAPDQGHTVGGPRQQPLGATQNDLAQLPLWGDGARWDRPAYYETITAGRRMFPKALHNADIDGDGRDELIGRGPGGILINRFDSSAGQWLAMRVPKFTDLGSLWRDDYGWNNPAYYPTIRCGDIDGDGQAELIGRGGEGIEIYRYDRSTAIPAWQGFIPKDPNDSNLGLWSDQSKRGNFLLPQYYQTIQCADVDKDLQAELIGRGPNGISIFKWDKSKQTWTEMYGQGSNHSIWSDTDGWNQPEHYQTIQCADINGDGQVEIIGRGNQGIEGYRFDRTTRTWKPLVAAAGHPEASAPGPCADGSGWDQPQFYSTIQCADIDGDGKAEIIGRSANGIEIFRPDANSQKWDFNLVFSANNPLAWNDPNGWNEVPFYSTIQSARALFPGDIGYTGDGAHIQSVLLGRGSVGMQTWRYDATLNKAVQTSVPVTAVPPLNDRQQKAFVQLDILLRGDGATGNIRDSYADTTAPFADWRQRMHLPPPPRYDTPVANRPATNLPLPEGIDQDAWEAVTWQIYWEIVWVQHVQDWFGNRIGTLLTKGAIGKSLTLQDIGDKLNIPPGSTSSILIDILGLAAAAVALAFAAAAAPPAAAAAAAFIGALFRFGGRFLPGGGAAQNVEYNKLQDLLVNSFTQAIDQNAKFQLRVLGTANTPADYGTLKAIGQMIEDTSWNWRVDLTDNMVDAMLRSYAVSIWQALLAAQPWHTWSDLGYGPPKDYPDKYVLKTSSNLKNWYWLSHDPDIDDSVPEGVLKDLFDPHQAGNIFPLGVPLADVFEGQNGWPRLQYGCPYFSGCEPPPGNTSLPSEFTSEPTLYPQIGVSRDENTKEILVEVTLYNQGLTPARNLEITDASLNGRKAAPTGLQTSVHQGDPQTILLRFPDIRKTTSANLKISGSYLGGKFDTTIRVEVP